MGHKLSPEGRPCPCGTEGCPGANFQGKPVMDAGASFMDQDKTVIINQLSIPSLNRLGFLKICGSC